MTNKPKSATVKAQDLLLIQKSAHRRKSRQCQIVNFQKKTAANLRAYLRIAAIKPDRSETSELTPMETWFSSPKNKGGGDGGGGGAAGGGGGILATVSSEIVGKSGRSDIKSRSSLGADPPVFVLFSAFSFLRPKICCSFKNLSAEWSQRPNFQKSSKSVDLPFRNSNQRRYWVNPESSANPNPEDRRYSGS